MRKPVDAAALFTGLALILLGSLFLLDRLGIADFSYIIRHYWPLIIVAVGAGKVLRRNVWGGLWTMAIGAWLQVVVLRLYGLTFRNSWPLLLIIAGAGIIVQTVLDSARRAAGTPSEPRHDT